MGLESQDTRGQIFQADLVSFEIEPPYSAEGGRISKGSVTLPNFGGSVLFMRVPFATELPHLTSNTYMWGRSRRVSWTQPRLPSQQSGVPAIPSSGGSVFIPTPFNAEQPNSAR